MRPRRRQPYRVYYFPAEANYPYMVIGPSRFIDACSTIAAAKAAIRRDKEKHGFELVYEEAA